MVVIGWSGMLWYCIVGVPLAVASIGTAKIRSGQAWQRRSSNILEIQNIQH